MEAPREPGVDPELACVVLSLRCTPGLVDAVRSLLDQSPGPEIVVVNSGGGDPAPVLRAAGLEVRVLNLPDRRLPGGARNVGIAATRQRYVAFLAADCRAEPGWVAARLRAHNSGARAVASVMTNSFPESVIASAADLRMHLHRMPDTPPTERLLYGVSYDRALFERFGPFREDLREGEDTDFNARMKGEVEIVWVPDVRTAHANPTRLRDLLRDQYARGKRSRVYDGLTATTMLRVTLVKETWRALAQARCAGDLHDRRRLIASWPLVSLASVAFSAGLVMARLRDRSSLQRI
ncbi:MAG: glycosyltransferase family 2 protein [Gaiellaceae bacterium]